MTDDEMVGWHHRLDGHGCERTPGDSKGQGSLACCSPWGHKESDTTYHLNNNNNKRILILPPWITPYFCWIALFLRSARCPFIISIPW